jgi:hypothetical protein
LVSSATSDSSLQMMEEGGEDVVSSSSLSFSSMSDEEEDDDDEHDVVPNDTTVIALSLSPATTPPQRRVRFSSVLEVRTYSIVLGDHPLCESLPLSLGWDYDPTPCWVDLETHEDSKMSNHRHYHSYITIPNRCQAHGVDRLSYLERKQLLMQVGGYSDHQLMVENHMIRQQEQLGTVPSMLKRLKHSQRFESLQHMICDEDQDNDHDNDGVISFSALVSADDL